jgi:hypothetical protein
MIVISLSSLARVPIPTTSIEYDVPLPVYSKSIEVVGIGTLANEDNDITIIYPSWEYDTTYQWIVTSTNCFGQAVSSTFSFTTQSYPTLDVASFDEALEI